MGPRASYADARVMESEPPADDTLERRVLITGGAGFVGANLAVALAERHPSWEIVE